MSEIINITHENTMKLLVENANTNVDDYVWALYDHLEILEKENIKLEAENKAKDIVIATFADAIKGLTHQHEDKGE
jgi:hypothetical protein